MHVPMLSRENCKVPMDGFLKINIENKSALLTVLGNGLKRCTRGSCRFQLLRSTIFFSLSQSNVKWTQGDFLLSGVWPRVNRLSMNERTRETLDIRHVIKISILTPEFTFMIGIL